MVAARKHLRICLGFLALLAGTLLALPLVPGPGIPLLIAGLVLLADHFTWARRSLDWVRRKWERIRS